MLKDAFLSHLRSYLLSDLIKLVCMLAHMLYIIFCAQYRKPVSENVFFGY